MAELCQKQSRTPQHARRRATLPPDVRALLIVEDPFPDGDGDAILSNSALRDTKHPDHQKTADLLAKARRRRATDWRCRCREAARRALREHMYARSHGPLCAAEIETTHAIAALEDEMTRFPSESLAWLASWQCMMDGRKI